MFVLNFSVMVEVKIGKFMLKVLIRNIVMNMILRLLCFYM